MGEGFEPIEWRAGAVVVLDQRQLPTAEVYNEYRTVAGVAEAIETMVIRGAPAISFAGAMGVALAGHLARREGAGGVRRAVREASETLAATRPTAVNLVWALERMQGVLARAPEGASGEDLAALLAEEATLIKEEDAAASRRMGELGADLLPDRCNVLTHCNTGALATGAHGTALGVIRSAVGQGKGIRVFADETRPLLQGARLTTWELARDGIDVTLIPDSAAGALMQAGGIDAAVVGADRIAANGDVANKIGTYTVAVLCRAHGIPFYVAAPTTTVDLETPSGASITIEERPPEEVTTFRGVVVAPPGVQVRNPAFDVTPAGHVAAIITEMGVARPPYEESLRELVKGARAPNR